MLPIVQTDGTPGSVYMGKTFGFDPVVTQDVQAVVRYNDKDLKVLNAFESPEFKSAVELAWKRYQAGYLNKDLVTRAEAPAALKAGKFAGDIGGVIKPGGAKIGHCSLRLRRILPIHLTSWPCALLQTMLEFK